MHRGKLGRVPLSRNLLFIIIILCLTRLHEKDKTREMINEEIENEKKKNSIYDQFILDPCNPNLKKQTMRTFVLIMEEKFRDFEMRLSVC